MSDICRACTPEAMHIANILRLPAHVERILGVALHAEGHFERLNTGLELWIAGPSLLMPLVDLGEQIELLPLLGRADRGVANVFDEQIDGRVPGVDVRSLKAPGRNPACQFCDS